jgi:hypothetical protein
VLIIYDTIIVGVQQQQWGGDVRANIFIVFESVKDAKRRPFTDEVFSAIPAEFTYVDQKKMI